MPKICPRLRHADTATSPTICLCVSVGAGNLPALLHGLGEFCKHLLCVFPANASVSDAHTILQAILALLGYFLGTYNAVRLSKYVRMSVVHTLVDVALYHDTHDCRLSSSHLLSKSMSDLGLVLVVLF